VKLTGYSRYSDSVLKKSMKRFIRDRGKPPGLFRFGNPLCPTDMRRCSQRGKLPKAGHCYDAYASMLKAGPCRKVEVEYTPPGFAQAFFEANSMKGGGE